PDPLGIPHCSPSLVAQGSRSINTQCSSGKAALPARSATAAGSFAVMTEGGRRTQWSLGIGLVVVGLLALVAVLVPSQQSTRNLTFSGVSRIEFDLGNSSVEIVESDVSEIEVVATSRYRFLRPRTSRSEEHTSELQSREHLVC